MSAITAKASRKMKKYAVLTREPRCFLGSFDFSWEQRKLGDVGETYTGLSGKTKADFGHGQARFVTYMNVFSNPISNPEMTEPIEIDPKQNEVEVGDVFFTTSSETPEEVGMSSVLLEKRGKIYLNSFCFGFRPTEKIDSYYLAYMLRSESAREKIILLAQGISRYNISKNKVMEIAVSLPSLDEQKLIGQHFRQLDNLITLHQRECISFTARAGRRILTANKKRNTSSWEQRKFSDVVATRRGLTYKPSDIRKNGVRVLRSSNIAEDSFVLSDEDVFVVREAVNIDCVRANDILITAANGSSRLVGKHTIISGIPEESAVHGGFMLLGTTKEPHFVNASMGSSWYRRFIELFVAGGNGAIGNLNKNDLDNQDIAIPSEKEQKKIGSFFRQLDNLITLHQRKPFLMKWRTSDANRNKTNRLVL